LIGHEMPSRSAALQFLYAFHEEQKIEEAKQQRLPERVAYIPEESPPLEGLGGVNRDLVQRFGERTPEQRLATVDQDTRPGSGSGLRFISKGWNSWRW
jgi:hypothetical protein